MSKRIFNKNLITSKEIKDANNNKIDLIYNLRSMTVKFHDNTSIEIAKLPKFFYFKQEEEGIFLMTTIKSKRNFENVDYHKLTGTYRSLINNAIKGFLEHYEKNLILKGAGYQAKYDEKKHSITMLLGYSHPVEFFLKKETSVKILQNGIVINLKSYNKHSVGSDYSKIKSKRKVNVYSGSGIHDLKEYSTFSKKPVKKS